MPRKYHLPSRDPWPSPKAGQEGSRCNKGWESQKTILKLKAALPTSIARKVSSPTVSKATNHASMNLYSGVFASSELRLRDF